MAAQFFSSACGMRAWSPSQGLHGDNSSIVIMGIEGAGDQSLNLKLVAAHEPRGPDGVFTGLSVGVPNIALSIEAALAAGADVVRPLANTSHTPSLVPDEDPEMMQPWFMRAVVREPNSGLDVELVEHPPSSPEHRPGFVLRHVTLAVQNLTAAKALAAGALGMTVHRYRSLVPTEPAMSAFVSYSPGEHAGTLLELRYSYGPQPRLRAPAAVGVAVPDTRAARAAIAAVAGAVASASTGAAPAAGVEVVALGKALEGLCIELSRHGVGRGILVDRPPGGSPI